MNYADFLGWVSLWFLGGLATVAVMAALAYLGYLVGRVRR